MRQAKVLSLNRRLLNFTYNMFNPADGSWGIVGEDYSWSGLAGHVAYGYRDTDIAICDIYNTYNWNKIFKPTTDFDRDIIQGWPKRTLDIQVHIYFMSFQWFYYC